MLFNSLHFAVFFPVVTILYFLLPHKHRWWLLLGASAYFYMAFVPVYILILGVTIVVDYFAGILIEEAHAPQKKKLYLALSLIANIGFLAFFKYFNFLNSNISALAEFVGWNYPIENLRIILPIGLSFHTFQAMSYTIEVFRGHQRTERHFGIYALYVLFYPQLVAGPIERPQNMLHQFHKEHTFDYQRVADGLKLMVWGLFKKVVIADRLVAFINPYYANPYDASGPQLALATACFAIQIFCDFSGYSDIALGAAQVMGFKLMVNFRRPYLALSISEFWKRWHVSLSTWFRDYLYIPLGGNRVSSWRWQLNLLIVFLVSGLWHGANWTFVIWGALHGLYLILEIHANNLWGAMPRGVRAWLPAWLKHFFQRIIVLVLVGFAWIFFRATSLESAFYIAASVFSGWSDRSELMALYDSVRSNYAFLVTLSAMAVMSLVHFIQEQRPVRPLIAKLPRPARLILYAGFVVFILVFGEIYSKATDFIYFQF